MFRTVAVLLAIGCDAPHTSVVLDNHYSPASGLVVRDAFWQAVGFPDPVLPGASSDPQNTIAASDNTAYVVLAPGWDPAGSDPPTRLVVLESRAGFSVHLNDTLHIPVDDVAFAGNCAAGSTLSQDRADFITQLVFPSDFTNASYDAATCTKTGGP
jgi:hypothetical protein